MSGSMADFEAILKPMARQMFREMLVTALYPLFGTAEQKAEAQAMVDAMSDEEIDERSERWVEEVSKYCPECGRPYEPEEACDVDSTS